ncbi:Fic family protein [Legionella longbeachae]|uniref:Fic family protein n=1 Tax=Legionella longbeachae TaxID=450 RepID=UPI001243B30F|nr:Fic family protein [Legionella longbeachae]QEY52986.1 cell filamentation protein Fic [Legionella longbeachae]
MFLFFEKIGINYPGTKDNEHNLESEYLKNQIDKIGIFFLHELIASLPHDTEIIKNVHKLLFSNLYKKAGEFRNEDASINLSHFSIPIRINDELCNYIKTFYKHEHLKTSTKKLLAKQCAVQFNLFNMIHPFYYGNGIINRLFINNYLLIHNYHSDWDLIEQKEYDESCNLAFHGDLNNLEKMVNKLIVPLSQRLVS